MGARLSSLQLALQVSSPLASSPLVSSLEPSLVLGQRDEHHGQSGHCEYRGERCHGGSLRDEHMEEHGVSHGHHHDGSHVEHHSDTHVHVGDTHEWSVGVCTHAHGAQLHEECGSRYRGRAGHMKSQYREPSGFRDGNQSHDCSHHMGGLCEMGCHDVSPRRDGNRGGLQGRTGRGEESRDESHGNRGGSLHRQLDGVHQSTSHLGGARFRECRGSPWRGMGGAQAGHSSYSKFHGVHQHLCQDSGNLHDLHRRSVHGHPSVAHVPSSPSIQHRSEQRSESRLRALEQRGVDPHGRGAHMELNRGVEYPKLPYHQHGEH